MGKHTPGPWIVAGNTVGSKHYGWVAEVNPLTKIATGYESADNAQLIAASPDLLEAIKTLESYAEKYSRNGNDSFLAVALLQARKAIAKAEGT